MKNILIIGGTSDIGFQLIKKISKNNSKIFFTYFNNKNLSKKICDNKPFIRSGRLDLNSKKNIILTLNKSFKFLKKIDTVILCSIKNIKRKKFKNINIDEVKNFWSTNFFGYIQILNTILSYQAENLTIINLSSKSLNKHSVGLTFYNSYKLALEELLLTIKNENPKIFIKNIRLGKYNTKGFRDTNKFFDLKSKSQFKILIPKDPKLAVKSILKN